MRTVTLLTALLAPALAAAAAPYGIDQRVPVTGLTFPWQSTGTYEVAIERAFPRLSFDGPLYLTVAPGDTQHLFVVTQRGTIYVFDNVPDPANATPFLTLDVDQTSNEGGLLGLAFHPDYASNGTFYVFYSLTGPLRSRISRFQVSANPLVADAASEQILLEMPRPFANHQGGGLQFGPDGKLYAASGDGGGSGDPRGYAQRLNNPYGKILRLEPDGTIPADNPFSGAGERREIWAYGLRNPWRFSFDRVTGLLWAGDVGQDTIEEIDVIHGGGNYGWNVYEGSQPYENPDDIPASAFERPIYEYPRSAGGTVIGGYVYRGSAIATLGGDYVYGDFLSNGVWALRVAPDGRSVANRTIGQVPSPSSFGQDHAGELYITSFDGGIYRIVPNTAQGEFPRLLSQTGLFTDTAALTPQAGLIDYAVNSPLWSDGAEKRRWLALEGTRKIRFGATGAWRMPAHTVVVKHFEMTLADGTRKRLETRVLLLQDSGWQGYVYRWNDAGTDAELLDDGASVELDVPDRDHPGRARRVTYEFPSRGACLGCHNAAAGHVLGLRTFQMNRAFDYGGVSDNQLRTLNHIGVFTKDIGAPTQYGALPDPASETPLLRHRARSYLDGNCAICHRPGGPAPMNMDLRYRPGTDGMHTHNMPPTSGDLGIAGARRIKPGVKEQSVLWERMRRLDGTRMPPLASHSVDPLGVDVVGRWIDAGAH